MKKPTGFHPVWAKKNQMTCASDSGKRNEFHKDERGGGDSLSEAIVNWRGVSMHMSRWRKLSPRPHYCSKGKVRVLKTAKSRWVAKFSA